MKRACVTAGLLGWLAIAAWGVEPAGAPAEGRPDFGVYAGNSTQPPPVVRRAKLPPLTTQPGDGETEAIYRPAIAWFDQAVERVDAMVPAAEAVAEKILAGGELYAAGSPGFIAELYGRAGGFLFLKEWTGQRLSEKDVLLIGQLGPREEGRREANLAVLATGPRSNGRPTIVHFAGHAWPQTERLIPLAKRRGDGRRTFIDTGAPTGSAWADVSLGQMATLAMAWAFQGEVFAAATRKNKTLAAYASNVEPHGLAWDRELEGKTLNPRWKLPPVPPGQLGKAYLLTCQRLLAEFLDSGQARQVRLASRRLAATFDRGGSALVVVSGHVHVQGAVFPRELPGLVMLGRTWEWRSWQFRKGDVLIHLGYLDYPERAVNEVLARDAEAITISCGKGPTDARRTHIDSHWTKWDSVVNVKDYPVRLLASSGVAQTPQWYALMAETLKLKASK